MPPSVKIYGMATDEIRWLALALESASAAHWPKGVPPVIAERLQRVREQANAIHSELEELSSVLLVSEVEGVTGETVELAGGGEDEEDEDPDERRPWEK